LRRGLRLPRAGVRERSVPAAGLLPELRHRGPLQQQRRLPLALLQRRPLSVGLLSERAGRRTLGSQHRFGFFASTRRLD
jgi:hypothetical protein